MCPFVRFLFLTLWLQMTALDNITCQLSQEKWHFQEDHNSHNKDDKFHRSLQQKGVQVLFQDRVLYILRERSLKFSKKWQNKKWNTLKTILMLFVSIATVKWWYRCLEVFLLPIIHFAHLSLPWSIGWVALSFLLFVRCPAMVTSDQISLLVAPHPQTHTFSESL